MTHRLNHIMGIIITLLVLLVIVVETGYAHQVRYAGGKPIPAFSSDDEQAEDTALVCLALFGGTALLAGSVWMKKLR